VKGNLSAAVAILLCVGPPAFAHRLDEYLQATTLSVGKDRVEAEIRLAPGVSVFPAVLAALDVDGDGAVTEAEVRTYGEALLRDLSLSVDGEPVRLRLVAFDAAPIEEMKEGRGGIRLEAEGDVARSAGDRTLVFENHHLGRIAAYLVNCVVPSDPTIRVTAQDRSYDQSFYRLRYAVAEDRAESPKPRRWAGAVGGLGAAALVLFARLAWPAMQRLEERCVNRTD
jgi:hypothetical protein